MFLKGFFEIDLAPVQGDSHPAGRMLISKTYSGDLVGTGVGQMLSKRTDSGASAYTAIEEVIGELDGKSGGFTLVHNGYMSAEEVRLDIVILPGSGSGELQGIRGTVNIIQGADGHKYEMNVQL